MGIEFKALTTIDQQFARTKVTEVLATRSLQALRLERTAVFQDMEDHLLGTSDEVRSRQRTPDSLDSLVGECVNQLAGLEGEQASHGTSAETLLREAFASLAVVHQELEQFEKDHRRTGDLFRKTWETLAAELVETREAADKLEGRERLRNQLVLRRYRAAVEEGGDVAVLASRYIHGVESARDRRIFSSELGDLALLVEHLHGEAEIDQLINLKDNEIRQTLARLYRAARKMARGDREKLASHIDSLMEVIFGEGAVDNQAYQTLVIGEGGLFGYKLQSLILEAQGRRLGKALSIQRDECLEAERAFNSVLDTKTKANVILAKSVFRAACRDTLFTGGVVAVIFLALSWRLANLGRKAEDQLHARNQSLKTAMNELETLATTDKLTGLLNRTAFLDRLTQVMKRSRRENVRFAVLFFDFDRFKVVNDSLGHDVGDALLCDIANIISMGLRETDTVARFGGDEFVVLLGGLTRWEDARHKAESLLSDLTAPHQLGDHLIVSTASIGLVTNERKYEYPGDMIRDADAAMYQAKENGKSQVVVFDRAMHANALERLSLEADLRVAVALDDQFRLMYQPIVELETGRVTGFEALIRWDHPIHGVVNPLDFIPIAEDTGLIVEIGRWVLRTAASQLADWNQRLGLGHKLKVNVNVSKRQLRASTFPDEALECLREFGLHPGELHLEITESSIVDDSSDVIPLLGKLREQGFPIVMDDFGTGVSSLSTLHTYPIDVLKIDQAFIRVLDRDRSLLAVVASITNLAENLGIRTVAEGIETEDIVGALQSIGCTWGQGYYFAKPLSPSNAEAYLLDHQKQRDSVAA